MKINNKKINISFAKMLSSFLVLGIFLSLTSCFEDEKELFYKTTVASIVDDLDESTLEVTFRDVSVAGDDAVYEWTFGDDTNPGFISNERVPTYAYPDEGEYEVTLNITEADGTTSSSSKTIEVSDGVDTEAIFDFAATGTGEFDFTNESTDALTYAWDFGNGLTSTDEEPSTVYDDLGSYTVKLTATSSHGEESVVENSITIGTGLLVGNQLVLAEAELASAEAELEDAEGDDVAAAEAAVTAAEALVAAANNLTLIMENTSLGMDDGYTFTISSVDLTTGSLTVIDTQITTLVDEIAMFTFTQAGDYIVTLLGTFTQLDGTIIQDSKEVSITVNSDGVII